MHRDRRALLHSARAAVAVQVRSNVAGVSTVNFNRRVFELIAARITVIIFSAALDEL